MKLEIPSFREGAPVPEEHCFFVPAPTDHVRPGGNRSPELRWSDVPAGTRSLVILVEDPDAPSVGTDVNKEGRSVSASLPRASFFHWVLVDIPSTLGGLPAGAESTGVVNGGKPLGKQPHGIRGQNDFTGWFAGDPKMKGTYGGYDGPAPPWNDEKVHRYQYKLFALDVPTLGLSGSFDARAVMAAMEGHILAKAQHTGTATNNPAVAR